MNHTITLTITNIFVATILILIAVSVSYALRLKLEKSLIIAAIRTIVQLSFIGLILAWVFARSYWYETLMILSIMTLIAAQASRARIQRPYKGLFLDSLCAIFVAGWIILFITLWIILNIHPRFTPQYLIPIGGMILGNALTAISLTAERFISSLRQYSDAIQTRLALSATPWEACRKEAAEALRAGMMPSINAMSVVGLVSLPGMMTGQILTGADPRQAVLYQIVVMFMMSAACAIACVTMLVLIFRRHFNALQQLIFPPEQLRISWWSRLRYYFISGKSY
ncbi:ABC transporter permease [Suttonella ornithocola]|uniref:ABC-type uncharacterized transport system, permease component n=1 Tax=Suttonella ornithocola TaxID=279832 RepID=A0A380MX12_9GAMM|nr:iron export ABC transporter permease subunit FetB [Suttonella ornithocola]SUO96251.1 ABC-type uncharacterized transport system, permease component [Suttonella ornithocola]